MLTYSEEMSFEGTFDIKSPYELKEERTHSSAKVSFVSGLPNCNEQCECLFLSLWGTQEACRGVGGGDRETRNKRFKKSASK